MARRRLEPAILRRYTDLTSLFHILQTKSITLLSPSTWDDRNDRNLMEAYARAKKLKTCLGLCFSEATETYHHWKVFAQGSAGVCIEFHKRQLLASLSDTEILHDEVKYTTIPKLVSTEFSADEIPFLKRAAFKDEEEYRLVYGSTKLQLVAKSIPIKLDWIQRIFLGPWTPAPLFEATSATICSISDCAELVIKPSKLIDNDTWRSFATKFA